MTNYCRLADLTNIYFSQFWGIESLSSRCIMSDERAHFLVHRQPHAMSSVGRGGKRVLWGSFYRHTTSIIRAPPHGLIASQRHYFLILSHWRVGFPFVFEKDTHVQPLHLKNRFKYSAFSLAFERPETGIVNWTEWDSVVWWTRLEIGVWGLRFFLYLFLLGFVTLDMVTSLGLPYFLYKMWKIIFNSVACCKYKININETDLKLGN